MESGGRRVTGGGRRAEAFLPPGTNYPPFVTRPQSAPAGLLPGFSALCAAFSAFSSLDPLLFSGNRI
jgi:hypothetical protein